MKVSNKDLWPRRAVLRRGTLAIGAAVMAGFGAGLARAQAKIAKNVVAYQDTPKDDKRCDTCALFQPPNACKTVAGDIAPSGWCRIWQPKT